MFVCQTGALQVAAVSLIKGLGIFTACGQYHSIALMSKHARQILRGDGLPIVLLQSKKTGAQLLCRGLIVQQFRGETFKFSPGLFCLSGRNAARQTTDAALIAETMAIA